MDEMNIGLIFLILLGGITVVVFFGQTLLKLSKIIWKASLHIIIGAIILFLFNLIGQLIQFEIPLNPITALIVGLLGIPGFISLLIIRIWIIPF